jgi:fructose-1-phosphate kinase PfkB-like protein
VTFKTVAASPLKFRNEDLFVFILQQTGIKYATTEVEKSTRTASGFSC